MEVRKIGTWATRFLARRCAADSMSASSFRSPLLLLLLLLLLLRSPPDESWKTY
jgi:hypothetical protein